MRTNIFLLLFFLFFIGYGCVSKKYIYIQNKTDHDIQVYKIDILDVGNDSDMKMVMQKNNLYSNLQNGKLTMRYQRVLKPDSLAFLDVVYGEKSKTELVDSNSNYFNGLLVILSKTDTIMFNQTEIIQKVNEAWFERNTDSSIKLKVHEKTRLTWKFRD